MKSNRSVVQLDSNTGEQLAVFGNLTDAAEAVGASTQNIAAVADGIGRTAVGFKWTWYTPDSMSQSNYP